MSISAPDVFFPGFNTLIAANYCVTTFLARSTLPNPPSPSFRTIWYSPKFLFESNSSPILVGIYQYWCRADPHSLNTADPRRSTPLPLSKKYAHSWNMYMGLGSPDLAPADPSNESNSHDYHSNHFLHSENWTMVQKKNTNTSRLLFGFATSSKLF